MESSLKVSHETLSVTASGGQKPERGSATPVPVPRASIQALQPEAFAPKPQLVEENNDFGEVIHSPLDQRCYKSITLPNGLRAMLISTYHVESYPDEMDATKTPCQIPEVSEFNKSYLGFDNPAARVKCSCPCDERKPCCGFGVEDLDDETKKKYDNIRQTCCSKNVPPPVKSDKSVKLKKSKNTGMGKGVPKNPEAYKAQLFQELREREERLKRARANSVHQTDIGGKYTQVQHDIAIVKKTKSSVDSIIYKENSKLEKNRAGGFTPITSEENIGESMRNSTLGRHYPNPPSYFEGLHALKNFPTGTGSIPSRSRSRRPHFSSDFNFDLEGTVYLVIGSGYFDDPVDQPGLAHFCEHAVFLGSAKFPEPNQLFKLVLPYDGYVNAYTSGMTTTFTASATYRLFPLAVEILGDMVGSPLFPNALVTAEIEALDSEYSLRQDDTPKYFQLIGSLAKKGHVMRKMDSGNFNTLTVPNFYRKLVEWRKIYYNPRRMTVALEAPFPLDFLEHMVIESFGKIPEGAPIPLISNRHLLLSFPFEMKRFHQVYHVPSVYHTEFIALHWALDAKAWKNLQVKPLEYLGAIICHRAEGGLFHYLNSQGLATNIDAGCWESDVTRNHYTTVFSISVDMTEKGFKRQDNILQAIFGYIHMLLQNGPQITFFQELQKQQLEAFHFRAAESTLSLAESVSRWMQFIPPKWCLISPSLTCKFDEELIQRYTQCLTIETANVIIFSKNYRGVEYSNQSSMEEYYNTPYASYNFPEELEKKLRRTTEEYSAKFSLPPPNHLLLDTSCCRSRERDLLRKGNLLKIKGKLTVSYVNRKVRLVRGLLPQARYSLWIGSPAGSYLGSPEGSSTKSMIWSLFFNELFQSKFYHVSNADVQLETEIENGELHVVLAGPHTMLPAIFEQFVDLFNNFENVIDETSFEVVKSVFVESLDNTILDNRFLAWDLFYFLWTSNHELIFDHKKQTDRLTFSDFVEYVKSYKKKMYIQVHLYGYVNRTQAETVVRAVSKIQYEPVDFRQYKSLRCLRLPLGERIIKVHSQNPNIHTSVVINSYQFGMLTEEGEDVVNFFAKSMSDAAFYKLRTEQQLGYIIIIYAEITFGVSSIVVELVTQPKNFSTDYCNHCIDHFLYEFFMENLSSVELYNEFCLGKPRVPLAFPVVQQMFSNYLLPNPTNYRKLSVQVVGMLADNPNPSAKNPEKQNSTIFAAARKSVDFGAASKNRKQGLESETKMITENVRAAKKSLQVRKLAKPEAARRRSKSTSIASGSSASSIASSWASSMSSDYIATRKSLVTTRVIKDVSKFKSNLINNTIKSNPVPENENQQKT